MAGSNVKTTSREDQASAERSTDGLSCQKWVAKTPENGTEPAVIGYWSSTMSFFMKARLSSGVRLSTLSRFMTSTYLSTCSVLST